MSELLVFEGFLVVDQEGKVHGASPRGGNKGLALYTSKGQAKAAVTRFHPGGRVVRAKVWANI